MSARVRSTVRSTVRGTCQHIHFTGENLADSDPAIIPYKEVIRRLTLLYGMLLYGNIARQQFAGLLYYDIPGGCGGASGGLWCSDCRITEGNPPT